MAGDSLAGSLRTYRRLMRLYPPRFRAEYGEEMLHVFCDTARAEQQRRGTLGVLALWLLVTPDLVCSAAREHYLEGFAAVRAQIIRTLALGGLAGGVLMIAYSVVAHGRRPGIVDGPYRDLDDISQWLALGLLFFAACLVGVYMRWSPRWPVPTRIACLLSITGAAWPLVAHLVGSDFIVLLAGYFVMIGSLFLTGFMLARQPTMQPCAWLLLGIGCSAFLFNTEDERVLFAAITGTLVLILSALLLAGLMRDRREPVLAA